MPGRIDITNQRFGRLVAIRPVGKDHRGGIQWLCHCDCGKYTTVTTANLRIGNTKSCGKHARANKPEYRVWNGMLNRCRNPNVPNYKSYGGRGITVDPRWNDFITFLNDVGPRPHPDFVLDRIDNHKGYFPDNVRWTDRSTSNKNRRPSISLKNYSTAELEAELMRRQSIKAET